MISRHVDSSLKFDPPKNFQNSLNSSHVCPVSRRKWRKTLRHNLILRLWRSVFTKNFKLNRAQFLPLYYAALISRKISNLLSRNLQLMHMLLDFRFRSIVQKDVELTRIYHHVVVYDQCQFWNEFTCNACWGCLRLLRLFDLSVKSELSSG